MQGLFCTLVFSLLCTVVLGGREKIMLNLKRESWISDNRLRDMIKFSLPFSRCANTYFSGQSIGVDILFNQFIKIYKYDYVMRATYNCQGYFGISSNPEVIKDRIEAFVPTLISTTEMLLIIDDEMSGNSSLLNADIFQNANVNIVSRSGMWTLSENFLFPRKFLKVNDLRELKHKRGIVDLRGRKLQVAAFYNPPFCYLKTSVNRTVKGVEGEFFIAEDERELDGIETKLFLLMSERLNFTWEIRKPNRYFRYGRPNGSDWNGGMIGQLFRKEVDFAFSSIWMKYDHYRFVNLSKPWYQLYITFLVPRPKPQTSIWALTRPLSAEVWFALIVMVALQSINLYAKAQINPNVPSRFKSYILTLTELVGRLVGSWAPKETRGLRIQLHLWHISGLLLVTAYCSSLASRLTTPDYEPRIDTLKQFIEANLTWGREGPTPVFDDYFNLRDKYAAKMPKRYERDESPEHRLQKIRKGRYAIIGRIVHGIFFPENHINDSDLVDYRVMKHETGNFFSSFGVQPWLLHSIDKMVVWMREGGLTRYHLTDVIHRRTRLALRSVLIEHDIKNDNGARVLILKPLVAGFGFFFFGLFASTIVFYCELKSKYPQKPIIEIMKEMRKDTSDQKEKSHMETRSRKTQVLYATGYWKVWNFHREFGSKKPNPILLPD